jgi:hypothetical protein
MFHIGHPLSGQFLLNFSKKARKILNNKCGEVENMTVTNDDEALHTYDLPEHFSESFQIFDELIKKAEMEPTNIQQVEAYLWVYPTLVKLFLPITPYSARTSVNGRRNVDGHWPNSSKIVHVLSRRMIWKGATLVKSHSCRCEPSS